MDKTLNKYRSLRSQESVYLTHDQFIELCQNHGYRLVLEQENVKAVQSNEPKITGGKTPKNANDSEAESIEENKE